MTTETVDDSKVAEASKLSSVEDEVSNLKKVLVSLKGLSENLFLEITQGGPSPMSETSKTERPKGPTRLEEITLKLEDCKGLCAQIQGSINQVQDLVRAE